METLTINLTQHPIDTTTLLQQLFDLWDVTPSGTAILLTHVGDGKALVARIRVKLSSVRSLMRVTDEPMHQFQLNTYVMPWTELNGTQYEAVITTKRQSRKHIMLEVFDAAMRKG